MRAAVIRAPKTVEMRELPPPVPSEGEVRVRIHGSGVCASNLPVWDGRPWFEYPLSPGSPGHEGWGEIDAVGPGVTGQQVGMRVAFLGEQAYAEYSVVSSEHVVAIPAVLDGLPCPAEPLGCAVNVIERARPEQDEVVAIVGIGFLGAALVQLAVARGAKVIAISRRPFARKLAIRLGAIAAFELSDLQTVLTDIQKIAGHPLMSCVIEAAGTQEALDLATGLTDVRGRLVVSGYHQDGKRTVDMQCWNWRGIDVINAHERDPHRYISGMRRALELAALGQLDLRSLITHVSPLEQLGQAFDWMQTRPDGFVKAVVVNS